MTTHPLLPRELAIPMTFGDANGTRTTPPNPSRSNCVEGGWFRYLGWKPSRNRGIAQDSAGVGRIEGDVKI